MVRRSSVSCEPPPRNFSRETLSGTSSTTDPPTHWNFKRLSKEDYGRHQRRKRIYAVHDAEFLGREVKIEFEPVRRWDEITNEYPETLSIRKLGWVEAVGEVVSGDEGGFMPSIYPVMLEEVETRNGSFHQITLSYGREYFDQVLKPAGVQ
jgi:predicted nucleotidyltransferase